MKEIRDLNILAIESSCDETAAAVVHNGREVLSNIISSQIDLHKLYGGVVPEIASRKHIEKINQVIEEALKEADVGIAMGGGSDVAIETAAITLMRHSLMGVADALAISRATLHNMKQNLLGAFIYNSIGIPVAAGILWPFTGTLLNPVVAGAAMALSSITVVSNANRLLRFKPKE